VITRRPPTPNFGFCLISFYISSFISHSVVSVAVGHLGSVLLNCSSRSRFLPTYLISRMSCSSWLYAQAFVCIYHHPQFIVSIGYWTLDLFISLSLTGIIGHAGKRQAGVYKSNWAIHSIIEHVHSAQRSLHPIHLIKIFTTLR